MSETIPSASVDYQPNLELQAADFTEWEQELENEPRSTELSGRLGELSLVETIEYEPYDIESTDEEHPDEPDESEEEPEKPKEKEEQLPYDPLNLQPERSSGESGAHATQDEMFSAAMGLIYFTTGISAEEVFEES